MTVAFAVTTAFMFALRPVAKSIGLIDRPGGRKLHNGNIPIIGGMAMFVGVVAGLAIISSPTPATYSLIVASLLLITIGALDDKYSVPPMVRILTQVAAILIMMYGANLSIASIGNPFGFGEVLLGPFTLLGTLAVGLTVVNAYNLVDGVDGLAGTLAIIALVSVAIVGGAGAFSTAVALTVAAAILGFLVLNFPLILNQHLRSFMGDAGSTFIGFTIVWVTLGISQGGEAVISPVAALWFASIPIYDCLTCLVRRIKAGRSPFKPGRDHFHHTLTRGGFGARQKLAILGGLQAIYASIGFLSYLHGAPDWLLFVGWSFLGLTQCMVIKAISKRNRRRVLRLRREVRLGSYQAAGARAMHYPD